MSEEESSRRIILKSLNTRTTHIITWRQFVLRALREMMEPLFLVAPYQFDLKKFRRQNEENIEKFILSIVSGFDEDSKRALSDLFKEIIDVEEEVIFKEEMIIHAENDFILYPLI